MGTAGLVAGAFLGAWWCRSDVHERLDQINDQVAKLRAAHDFEFSSLCRRMSDVEKAAAIAAVEARIMCAQLDRRLPEPTGRDGGG
ncbi:MAG TPA: hypothetical protein VF743_09615 [Acidimicrobiales bacterium]